MVRLALCLLAALFGAASRAADPLPLERIQLPPGFRIDLFARVPNAREMALGARHVLFVGSMQAGKVYALQLDERLRPGPVHVVAAGLLMPVGVAYRDGSLYVSAVDRILRLDDIERRLDDPPSPVVVRGDLPKET